MSNFDATAIALAAKSSECVNQIEELNTSLDSFEETADGNFETLNSQFNELQEIVKSTLERLETLETSGSRIRMSNPDGTSRYLSPDEITKEMEVSRNFLKDACGRP